MFAPDQYELLDFGEGRKLERFGSRLLDRPAPGTENLPRQAIEAWDDAAATYTGAGGGAGSWQPAEFLGETWTVQHEQSIFHLKSTEFGHLGLFPEQAANWDWLADMVRGCAEPPLVLNLFAYTGGSTLAAAAAGAKVVHVDAARNVVNWARRNAEASGLGDAPIRWICEDAWKFVRRELRRGNEYDAVILDPPTYGRGPRGEVFRLSRHLASLLTSCAELTAGRTQFMLLTCHTPTYGPRRLAAELGGVLHRDDVHGEPLTLATHDGRQLRQGVSACWPRAVRQFVP